MGTSMRGMTIMAMNMPGKAPGLSLTSPAIEGLQHAETREIFAVTSVAPATSALAAIKLSNGPMGIPRARSWDRSRPAA